MCAFWICFLGIVALLKSRKMPTIDWIQGKMVAFVHGYTFVIERFSFT